MPTLHRPRCLLHSLYFTQIRTLRTLPREIPTYIKRWDPTLHRSNRPRKVLAELDVAQRNALADTSRQAEREELRRAQDIVATHQKVSLGRRHAGRRLGHLLRFANHPDSSLDTTLRASLWRAYTVAKAADPKLLGRLSHRAWDLLWSTQSVESPTNRKRRAHLEQLYRDMHVAGRNITVGQRVRYLESMFLSGKQEYALQEWEREHTSSEGPLRQDYKPEHLEVGAKLHALAGKVDRAREIMEELFRLYPGWNTSVMMTVFRAHTSSELKQHHDLAKDIYVAMKERNGHALTIEDFDAWLVGFLEARHVHYAKQVFRDMFKHSYSATPATAEQVHEVLKRLHMLYRLGTDISKMTSIALDAISILPEAYHGHLFGDWMKSAVVHKAPEAAGQILDVMFRRGHKPETFHFNMLLKALLRTKEKPNVLKAENIGWRMIDEASNAHKKTLQPDSLAEVISQRSVHKRTPTIDDMRTIPRANVTTFALIMHHHARSLQWEHVDYLSRQLKGTSVQPNATIMNVLMDNKCRQGNYAEAWTIYKTLTEPKEGSEGVFPNGASFHCLWKTLRLALGDHATRSDPNLPTPRELLKEMVTWWTLARSRYDAKRFQQGLAGADHGAITALIMHCFSYTQDLAGSLVSLHVLRHKFDIFPTDKVAQILQRQVAWVDMARESDSVRSQYFHSRSNKKHSDRVARVYEILLERRLDRMHASGIDHTTFSVEQVGDAGLDFLSEFVRVVLKRSYPPDMVEDMIDAARKTIGLPELPTGDMDAFKVA